MARHRPGAENRDITFALGLIPPYDQGMRIRSLLGMLVCVVSLGNPAQPAFAGTGTVASVRNEGQYSGVSSGAGQDKRNRVAAAKATLSWLGFAAKNGGAEVFFQASAPFEIEQRVDGGVLSVRLVGLTKQVANTRRAIDTRYFDNPLARVSAKAIKGKTPGIDVRIVFKNAKDAKQGVMRTATEADGLFYVYLTFPEDADAGDKPVDNSPN